MIRLQRLFGTLPLALGLLCLASSCAIHYFDEDTGTEHVWGFGHMKMKVAEPDEGVQAVVHGTDVVGLSVGKAHQHVYGTVGWHRLEFIEIVEEDVAIRLEWPDSRFVNVRVGTRFPLEGDFPYVTPPPRGGDPVRGDEGDRPREAAGAEPAGGTDEPAENGGEG